MVTVSTEDKDSLHPVKEGDERSDHTPSIWDPPGNLWVKEYQYPPFTMEVMIAHLFQQVWDLLKCSEERNRKPIPWNDEANAKVEGLNNILVMEVKLLWIDKLSKVSRDLVNYPN